MTRIVTTTIEDKPGQLGRLARALADKKINIEGFEADHGHVTLLANDPDAAAKCLNDQGFKTQVNEAFELRIPNEPGRLAEVGEALGKANVNIVSSFGSGRDGRMYLAVDNPKAATPVLERFGTAQVTAGR